MEFMIKLTVVLGLSGIAGAQVLSKGKCPDVKVQEEFDINKYVGRWYEQRRFYAIFEMFSKLTTAEYSLNPDGLSVVVNNTGYNRLQDKYMTEIGKATILDPKVKSKLNVAFNGAPGGQYWVLSTDYDTYTVVWSCTELPLGINAQLAWILSRSADGVSESKLDELMGLIRGQGIDTKHFLDSPQF